MAAEVSWIKIKIDMFDDEKIRLIQAMPESDAILLIWIRLLALAGKTNDEGMIYIDSDLPYTDEILSTLFNKPVNTIRLALQTLQKFKMIDIFDNGRIYIMNWEKHQALEGLDKIKEQNKQRSQKFRDKQKLLKSTYSNKDTDKELDKDIEECVTNNVTVTLRFDKIWSLYPKKQGKKQALAAYKRAIKNGVTDEVIIAGINSYINYIKREKIKHEFIKQGSTWFNQECWNDDYSLSAISSESGIDESLGF